MRPRRILTPEYADEVFSAAVRERALAVVTTQEDDDWVTFKCRFLEYDSNRRFFVLDYQPDADHRLPELLPGQYVGVSFRQKSRKVLFATVVEARGRFVLDDQASISAIRYRWPDGLTELQRRAYYRTPIPEEIKIIAGVWEGATTAREKAQETTVGIRTGRLLDLSCGGGLIQLNDATLPEWTENGTLGVELQLDDERTPLLLNAHYRGTRPDGDGRPCIAIQFVGLELSVDGRMVLQRLARTVQRYHASGGNGDRNGRARFRRGSSKN